MPTNDSLNETGVIVAIAGFVLVAMVLFLFRDKPAADVVSLVTAVGTIVGTVVGAVFGVKVGAAGTQQANADRDRAQQSARDADAHLAALRALAGPDAVARAATAARPPA
jgi:uncharacterized membrane protein